MNDDDELVERVRASLHEHAARVPDEQAVWGEARLRPLYDDGDHGDERPAGRRPSRSLVALAVAASLVVVLFAVRRPGRTHVQPTAVSTSTSIVAPPSSTSVAPSPASSAPARPGFQPISVTFVSTDHGWALGTVPCEEGCFAVEETTDGGRSWIRHQTFGVMGSSFFSKAKAVGIRFADDQRGWIYGQGLMETSDGGATWHESAALDIADQETISSFETGGGQVFALVTQRTPDARVRLLQSKLGSGTWTETYSASGTSPSALAVQQGTARFAVSSATGDQLVTVRGAAAPVSTTPPCADPVASVASHGAGDVAVVCAQAVPTAHKSVLVSHDGGATFQPVTELPYLGYVVAATMADARTIVVAGSEGSLVRSFDDGSTWTTSAVDPASGGATWPELGFTTEQQGVAVVDTADGSQLLLTTDGGHSWKPVSFPG
jgi:photosystem II stability/assembly factor-like uncharacterized protein